MSQNYGNLSLATITQEVMSELLQCDVLPSNSVKYMYCHIVLRHLCLAP